MIYANHWTMCFLVGGPFSYQMYNYGVSHVRTNSYYRMKSFFFELKLSFHVVLFFIATFLAHIHNIEEMLSYTWRSGMSCLHGGLYLISNSNDFLQSEDPTLTSAKGAKEKKRQPCNLRSGCIRLKTSSNPPSDSPFLTLNGLSGFCHLR